MKEKVETARPLGYCLLSCPSAVAVGRPGKVTITVASCLEAGWEKNRVLGLFGFSLGFWGFFWFFLGFFGPDERVFRGFFNFTNTFRCIQTLNYNHSY